MRNVSTFYKENEIKKFYNCYSDTLPPRGKHRSNMAVELIIFSKFIRNCLDFSQTIFPISIIYDDRPDFIIECCNKKIGIELTEQYSKNYGHALKILEYVINGVIENSDFSIEKDTKKMKFDEIKERISKKKLTGDGSEGIEEEINWIKRIIMTTVRKKEKYCKYNDYKSFDENFLVIFDVGPEIPNFNLVTDKILIPLYNLSARVPFSKIFCIDSHIIEIDLKNKNFNVIKKAC